MSRAFSALGETALLLPASVLLLVYLLVAWQPRLALGWALALAACGSATVAFKLAFHACGRTLTDFDVVSPSGHASFATLFYGALALLLAAGRDRWQRRALGAATLLLVLLIGASRVRIGAHSVEEVTIGLGVGAAALALFAAIHARTGRAALSPVPVAAGFAVALVMLGGQHLPVEHVIAAGAWRLSAALDICAAPARAAEHGAVMGNR